VISKIECSWIISQVDDSAVPRPKRNGLAERPIMTSNTAKPILNHHLLITPSPNNLLFTNSSQRNEAQ
jgi:hypothetical protein